MKLIDEKGKLFGKVNAIDLCVLIIVIALAFGAYYKFVVMNKTSSSASTQRIEYKVEIERVRDVALNNLKLGDTLYDKTSGNAIGTITNIESEPAEGRIKYDDGSVAVGEVENRYNIILTVEADGVVNESGSFVNRTYELLVGSKKKFVTKYIECDGSVSEIL